MVFASIVLALFAFAGPVAVYVRNRRKKRRFASENDQSEPLQGTEEDLRRAEASVRGSSQEIRENLLRENVLIQRLETNRGFSREYVDQLVAKLASKGIDCQVYFQETLPMGVGNAFISPQGIFELYVLPDRADEATLIVSRGLP